MTRNKVQEIGERNNAGYRGLKVYEKAHELVLETYKVTSRFPKEELFGLVSQMRRSAVSVVANTVEGYGRKTKNDKVHFYHIARGSLTELEYYIDLSLELDYLDKEKYRKISSIRNDTGKLLGGLIRATKAK